MFVFLNTNPLITLNHSGFTLNRNETYLSFTLNDLLGGRGWWLVKGALVRGPFLFVFTVNTKNKNGL